MKTKSIPFTDRQLWMRDGDRYTWIGFNGRYSSPTKPTWKRVGKSTTPIPLIYWEWDVAGSNYETGGSSQNCKVRRSSLCRIAPARKARLAKPSRFAQQVTGRCWYYETADGIDVFIYDHSGEVVNQTIPRAMLAKSLSRIPAPRAPKGRGSK